MWIVAGLIGSILLAALIYLACQNISRHTRYPEIVLP
jgi:hypothetical protein